MGEGGGGEEKGTSLPFSLPFFPFSPETPDTQASPFFERVLIFSHTCILIKGYSVGIWIDQSI